MKTIQEYLQEQLYQDLAFNYNANYSVNKVIKLLEFKIEETIKKINKNIVTLSKNM